MNDFSSDENILSDDELLGKIPKRSDVASVHELIDGAVINKDDNLHTLNNTAVEILELCDGVKSVTEIRDIMCSRYTEENVSTEVIGFIRILMQSNLVIVE